MVIFTLLCSMYMDISVSNRLLEQFQINLMLLLGRSQVDSKLINSLYLMSFAIVVEFSLNVAVYIASRVGLRQKWASFALLGVSGVCLVGSLFDLFNYWRVFMIAVFFFFNSQNVTVFAVKLYFLKEDMLYGRGELQNISDLGLLTMWLYTSLLNQ
jgi:hypothetical protein